MEKTKQSKEKNKILNKIPDFFKKELFWIWFGIILGFLGIIILPSTYSSVKGFDDSTLFIGLLSIAAILLFGSIGLFINFSQKNKHQQQNANLTYLDTITTNINENLKNEITNKQKNYLKSLLSDITDKEYQISRDPKEKISEEEKNKFRNNNASDFIKSHEFFLEKYVISLIDNDQKKIDQFEKYLNEKENDKNINTIQEEVKELIENFNGSRKEKKVNVSKLINELEEIWKLPLFNTFIKKEWKEKRWKKRKYFKRTSSWREFYTCWSWFI